MTVKEIMKKYSFLKSEDFGEYSSEGESFIILEGTARAKLIKELGISYSLLLNEYLAEGHAVVHIAASFVEWNAALKASKVNSAETFGTANHKTTNYPYFVEVAEKRALDRVVRKLTGLEGNILGRDELIKQKFDEGTVTPAGQQEVLKHIKKLDTRRDAPTKAKEATNKKQSK